MSNYKASDTEFQAVANAIRTKGGTSEQLSWPTGFVNAIGAIPSGSGSGDTFAFVHASWDAGVSCTATNGTVTLTSPDTSGSHIFAISTPSSTPETWTFAAGNTSIPVVINEYGESITIAITSFEDKLKATNYARLSHTIGDYLEQSSYNIKCIRDAATEMIACETTIPGSGNYGWCFISKYNNAFDGICTGATVDTRSFTIDNGTKTLYCYSQYWLDCKYETPVTGVIGSENVTFNAGNVDAILNVSSGVAIIGSKAAEFEDYLIDYYNLY